jgi:hypothetical protein
VLGGVVTVLGLGAALRPDVLVNGERVGEAVSWGFFWD